MNYISFEWNKRKASLNLKKHGVSFEEAQTIFYDDLACLIDDYDHSEDEDRFLLMGLSNRLRFILVCHCYRLSGGVVRIISARKATSSEIKFYPIR